MNEESWTDLGTPPQSVDQMTWVIGCGVLFGYGALISDVRVSWPDGQYADVLQKIYPVGPMMACGFAGSVELGFEMIEDMRRAFAAPPQMVWFPRIAAWEWWRHGRRIFSQASSHLRDLGCALILVGVSAEPDGMVGHKSYAVLMRSPDFYPSYPRRGVWVSIGTGADHEYARQIAQRQQDVAKFLFTHGQGEVAMGRGGMATTLGFNVAQGLIKNPMTSVSQAVQVGLVFGDTIEIRNLSTTIKAGTAEEQTLEPGKLISSWGEFQKWCLGGGRNSVAASATRIELNPPTT